MPSEITPRSQLYALLIAINDYQPPVPALRGCVNDLEKVASYLERESSNFDVRIKRLVNAEATKENIVNTFAKHFDPVTKDDVVFFYFSGHGTQEDADQVFWSVEEDHKLESIVPYDGYTVVEGQHRFRLLADKELRYMISNLAKREPHILTIFDCCHSGGNTRNGIFSSPDMDVRERRLISRLSQAFPARAWNEFIFSDAISMDDAKENSISRYLTEGKHVQMAACQHDESAYEAGGEGMFTKNLLEILTRCEGSISYYDLQSRIQNYLRYQFKQTPKIYVSGDDESVLFLGFLNKQGKGKPLYGNINFNQTDGWVIDFGTMHGLSHESTVKVVGDDSSDIGLAKVKESFGTYSQLQFEKAVSDKLNESLSYRGYSDGYFSAFLRIHIESNDPAIKQDLTAALTGSKNLTQVESETDADYLVRVDANKIFISRPLMPMVPIVRPVDFQPGQSGVIIHNYLQHISQFEFVKKLENQNSFLFSRFPVDIVVSQRNAQQVEQEIPIKEGEIHPTFTNGQSGQVRIRLKNNSDRKLYCALLYLTFNFGVVTKLLKDVVVKLEPNGEVWARDGEFIGLNLEEEVFKFNYKESLSTLKLIVSTDDFNQQVARFDMPELPGPLNPGERGLNISSKSYIPEIQDWVTRNVDIKISNPDFKP